MNGLLSIFIIFLLWYENREEKADSLSLFYREKLRIAAVYVHPSR